MRNIVLALVVALASVGVASAQTKAPKAPVKADTTKAAPAKAKSAVSKGEVVSTDAAAKTITVKDSAGASATYTATGTAVASLGKLKAGDHVSVTHNDTTATKIVKAPAAHAKSAKAAVKK